MSAMQILPRRLALSLLAGLALMPGGCATSSTQRELQEAQELIRRYEQKYGQLDAAQGRRDFRELQRELRGKRMAEVTRMIGTPSRVENFGGSESWVYLDAAQDPATGRLVRRMTVWFKAGVVDETRASY